MTFHFIDIDNDSLTVTPWAAGGPGPVVGLIVERSNGKSAGCFIPVARVEELVAGIRDAARTASGQQPEPTVGDAQAMLHRMHADAGLAVPAVGQPAEAQATDEVCPPHEQWRIQVYDADKWNSLTGPMASIESAAARRSSIDMPTRIVRETTTWTVEDETR